jgi:hypothetical protein
MDMKSTYYCLAEYQVYKIHSENWYKRSDYNSSIL